MKKIKKTVVLLLTMTVIMIPFTSSAYIAPDPAKDIKGNYTIDLPSGYEAYPNGWQRTCDGQAIFVTIDVNSEKGSGMSFRHIAMQKNEDAKAVDAKNQDVVKEILTEECVSKVVTDSILKIEAEDYDEIETVPQSQVRKMDIVENDAGEYMAKAIVTAVSDDEILVYIMPVREDEYLVVETWEYKGTTINKMYEEGSETDAIILSYNENEKLREAVQTKLDYLLNVEGNRGNTVEFNPKGSTVFLVLGGLFAFCILFNIFFIKRHRRQVKEARENGETYKEDVSKKIRIVLTCINCKKEFEVYVDPGMEEITRRNTQRCPECKKELLKQQEYIASKGRYSIQ